MQSKETLLLILLLGVALPLGLCLGCTSEQWVKEYVKGETAGLQETLNRHTADAVRRQEELEKKQVAMEGQITEMRTALGTIGEYPKKEEVLNLRAEMENKSAKLEELEKDLNRLKESQLLDDTAGDKESAALTTAVNDAKPEKKQMAPEGQVTEMHASPETTGKSPKEEILSLRSEIEKQFAELAKMEEELNRLKGLQQLDYTARDKELAALTTTINDAKRFVDMNVTEVLKAQNRLKDFIIEEVRSLLVEHQEYARELEVIKGRLQTIEGATEKKKPPEM